MPKTAKSRSSRSSKSKTSTSTSTLRFDEHDGMFHTASPADIINFMADEEADDIMFVGAKEELERLKKLPPFYQLHKGKVRLHGLRFGTYNGRPTYICKGYATDREHRSAHKLTLEEMARMRTE